MVPDRGFTKQLKKLDPEFEVLWNWRRTKWEIWKFPKEDNKKEYHVLTVETKDKSYKELGADILLQLQWGNPDRWGTNELANYLDELDNQNTRRQAKDFSAKISAVANDSFDYIHIFKRFVPQSYKLKGNRKLKIANAVQT